MLKIPDVPPEPYFQVSKPTFFLSTASLSSDRRLAIGFLVEILGNSESTFLVQSPKEEWSA